MADIFSKEIRSKIMSCIRGKNSYMERYVASELHKRGIRFRRNVKDLPGTPDIAIKKYKIVIFLDSCFWHACPKHFKMPKSNYEFWENKINHNIKRDLKTNQYYIDNNWHILRIWEHEIYNKQSDIIENIARLIEKIKSTNI